MNKTPSSKYRIRFHDCDMFKHLNNARYLDYMISARQDHLKDYYDFDYNSYYDRNLGWVIGHHEIQYLKPALFEETVTIQSCLLQIERESLLIEILMMDENMTSLKAILKTRLIFINLATGRKEQHSDEFMDWAKNLIPENLPANYNIFERAKQLGLELRKNRLAVND